MGLCRGDEVRDFNMGRVSWIIQVGPRSLRASIQGEERDKGVRVTEGEVTMEAEFEVMWKGCEPRNEAFRSLKRQGNEFSEASGRSISLPAHLGLLAPGTER